MALYFEEFAVAATATSLADSLGITDIAKKQCKQVILQALPTSANDIYVGGSGVTTTDNRGAALRTAGAVPSVLVIGPVDGNVINIGEIYTIGTVAAGNRVLVTLVS